MSVTSGRAPRSGYVQRSTSSGLADVLDVLLDKGLVIDIFLRVSLVGIELLTVDARIVIASVDTYLRFAEAVNRLDIGSSEGEGLPQLIEDMTQSGASSKTRGVLEGAKESLFGSGDEGENEEEESEAAPSRRSSSRSSGSGSRSRSRSSSRGRS
ncbi:MAG: gas vesicle structural protein GvpA [Solirubrobacterales bacterium]|nr:gas vesicle structural protein GvpA [Solirubrobacterales bacterium]MBV8949031.1 gas vesicle structural protein GvpA [Solirubrobacterales bacterium]MBV9364517.1 gas vesicle structural protein GvpA [Solirubrobacterales bacterium]MBV9683526.1 gas vesicle structural protein GvpA [Solirubrobacterales bacterium]MBV9810881.1 gas vesicle structural protein GvpA [Solirubrobacterales bacterium]